MERRNCLAEQVGAFTETVRIVAGVATACTAHSRKTMAVVSRDVRGMRRIARERDVI